MAWFLDTNILIYCLRAKSPTAMRRIQSLAPAELRVPLQVHAELLVGVAKSRNPSASLARVQAFLAPFAIAWPDADVEEHYVEIRTFLERVGTPISEADLWIAATARAAAGSLVTNNTNEFARVPNLSLEDWTIP